VLDFDPDQDLSVWQTQIDLMINQGGITNNEDYIAASTKALVISFSLYNPSTDAWIAVEMLIEFFGSIISPSYIISRNFDANLIESSQEKGVWSTEYLRLFLSFYVSIC